MQKRFRPAALAGVAVVLLAGAAVFAGSARPSAKTTPLDKVDHIVVIYEENHSFDNLYGGWEGVNGRANATAAKTTQVDQAGVPYTCLKQNDVNLAALPATCTDSAHGFTSAFTNSWFLIDPLIPATATTCPTPQTAFSFPNGVPNGQGLPGGCTRDLVHKFYQEQYQLNGGAQNRYMVGSDAIGLTMGQYDTTQLPIYKWLHEKNHPDYVIEDNFFQSAFGGSFLNHQYLIAAQAPFDANAPAAQHSLVDTAGFPRNNYPLYIPIPGQTYRDGDFTVPCPSPKAGLACGNYAVNTMQPSFEPSGTFGDKLVPQTQRDDRRPADGEGRRLGVVRGRLGRRGGSEGHARLHERPRADVLEPESRSGSEVRLSAVPGSGVPVPPPAVQLLRELRARHAGTRAPAGRGQLPEPDLVLLEAGQRLRPEARLVLEADRRGERASGLREHRERQQQARQCPEVDSRRAAVPRTRW